MRTNPWTLLLIACCLLPACAGSREARRDPERPTPPAEAPRETPREAPRRPVTRTVQGFRIQLVTTPEKAAADRLAEQARAWWRGLPAARRPAEVGPGAPAVDVRWKQPYYRVRFGAFASRAEAERVLSVVAAQFPEAFIVPDTVTVTR